MSNQFSLWLVLAANWAAYPHSAFFLPVAFFTAAAAAAAVDVEDLLLLFDLPRLEDEGRFLEVPDFLLVFSFPLFFAAGFADEEEAEGFLFCCVRALDRAAADSAQRSWADCLLESRISARRLPSENNPDSFRALCLSLCLFSADCKK